MLYLIEILHQTTTYTRCESISLTLYLIEILHQTTTFSQPSSHPRRCILSKFYIKPQQGNNPYYMLGCCILSKFYIKPQLWRFSCWSRRVVSYRNSTSNHNSTSKCFSQLRLYLIEILHQTTTRMAATLGGRLLYLIEILHQTTTYAGVITNWKKLYLIEILHQTTTTTISCSLLPGCILSKFYIKPQLIASIGVTAIGCILSKFYIKPQLPAMAGDLFKVVSYRNSTSNHNLVGSVLIFVVLYLIEILHQTTTGSRS